MAEESNLTFEKGQKPEVTEALDVAPARQKRQSSTDPSSSSRSRRPVRDKSDQQRLPTPPPLPVLVPDANIFDEAFARHKSHLEAETLKKEGEFLDYLMQLPTPSDNLIDNQSFTSATAFAATLEAEDAFNHLDRLYVLMEQVLTLREKNSKLARRVREMEHVRIISNAHQLAARALWNDDASVPDEDTSMAESLLNAMLSTDVDHLRPKRSNGPLIPRQRSQSVEGTSSSFTRHEVLYRDIANKRRSSGHHGGGPKVSKWTKVKAAFKWERAYTGTGIPEPEVTRYLKVPDSANVVEITTMSSPPTPGSLSLASSCEELNDIGQGNATGVLQHRNSSPTNYHQGKNDESCRYDVREDSAIRQNRSFCEGSNSAPSPSASTTQVLKESVRMKKGDRGNKTAWNKVKDIIQARRRPENDPRCEDGYSLSSVESSEILQEAESGRSRTSSSNCPTPSSKRSGGSGKPSNKSSDLAVRRLNPALTITVMVPSNEELRGPSSSESMSPSHTPESLKTSHESPATASHSIADSDNAASPEVNFTEGFRRQISSRGESLRCSPQMQRHNSKWYKVKKAFLPSSASVPQSPNKIGSFFTDMDGLDSDQASMEDLENRTADSNIQAEIQRNYNILHSKLSAEFYSKYTEWDKMKTTTQQPDTGTNQERTSPLRTPSSKDQQDNLRLRLLGEDHLSPEFRKKLEEWKSIKKGYQTSTNEHHAAGRRRFTDWQLWRSPSKPESKSEGDHSKPQLSDDFLKKMEEWKRIRSAQFDDTRDNSAGKATGGTSYTGQIRKFTSHSNASKPSKSHKFLSESPFNYFEKELGKIDRDHPKIDRRDRFLDREARLSKLRRVVVPASQKKEVLVQTATGSFRFEGISRKFTRKLYEWEKSQGISAESSTFLLLNSRGPKYQANIESINTCYDRGLRNTLKRSKSVGSIVEEGTKIETAIREPSSLSLNDMEELEAECMAADSRVSSEPMITGMVDEMVGGLDDYEPEAMIVEFEDVIEETASPMTDVQPRQTPVYSVAASETTSIAVPLGNVTSSHEPSPVLLVEAGEHFHPTAMKISGKRSDKDSSSYSASRVENEPGSRELSETRPTQRTECRKQSTATQNEGPVARNKTGNSPDARKPHDELNSSSVDKVDQSSAKHSRHPRGSGSRAETEQKAIFENSVDGRRRVTSESPKEKNATVSAQTVAGIPEKSTSEKPHHTLIEDEITDNTQQRTTNKSGIKFASSSSDPVKEQTVTIDASKARRVGHYADLKIESEVEWKTANNDAKEASAVGGTSRSTFGENLNVERIVINENTLEKIIVPTANNKTRSRHTRQDSSSLSPETEDVATFQDPSRKDKSGPKNVFVKTTRMIFSPFRRESKTKIGDADPVIRSRQDFQRAESSGSQTMGGDIDGSENSPEADRKSDVSKRPPLPRSPVLARKEYHKTSPKDPSSSIRIMIQRYNKKLDETGSPASSGSASPIWRSPISERRVRARTEKYLIDAEKAVSRPSILNKEISKSASAEISREREKIGNAEPVRSATQPICVGNRSNSVGCIGRTQCSGGATDAKGKSSREGRDDRLAVREPRSGKLSPALVHKLETLSMAAAMKERSVGPSSRRPSGFCGQDEGLEAPKSAGQPESESRAKKIQEARHKFLSSSGLDPAKESKNEDEEKREEDEEFDCRGPLRLDLVKSASAGMINVDPDTFERLYKDRGCESLPRTAKRFSESSNRFTSIASKFRRARIRRAKDKEQAKMSTVSMLCRQSLFVDIQGDEGSESCPTTPAPQRDNEESTWSRKT